MLASCVKRSGESEQNTAVSWEFFIWFWREKSPSKRGGKR